MKYSIIIPAHNEEDNITKCVQQIKQAIQHEEHEIIIVNDGSTDNTQEKIEKMARKDKHIKLVNRPKGDNGFGKAVKTGYKKATGDYATLMMADQSDDPRDLRKMIRETKKGYDVITGNRFTKQSKVINYPRIKLLANRAFNQLVAKIFNCPYKDLSNAFKTYKKEIIKQDYESNDFDLTIEVPIKAWQAGYQFKEIPNNWYGRTKGQAKFGNILKAGKKYLKRLIKLKKQCKQ